MNKRDEGKVAASAEGCACFAISNCIDITPQSIPDTARQADETRTV